MKNSLIRESNKEDGDVALMRARSARKSATNVSTLFANPFSSCFGGGNEAPAEDGTEAAATGVGVVGSHSAGKMPPSRTRWWQVTLYIINDVVGAWLLLYSSLVLGMWGWVLGLFFLISKSTQHLSLSLCVCCHRSLT